MSACKYCVAAGMADYCGLMGPHDERTQSIARQLARMVEQEEPSDQQVGYFMDDACEVAEVVTGEVMVKAMRPTLVDQHRFSANGHVFAAAEEGGGLVYRGQIRERLRGMAR